MSRETAEDYRREAPDWALVDDATRIERTYRFKNFAQALGFVERAAALAEAANPNTRIAIAKPMRFIIKPPGTNSPSG